MQQFNSSKNRNTSQLGTTFDEICCFSPLLYFRGRFQEIGTAAFVLFIAFKKREHWSLQVKYAPDISHGCVATRFRFDDINDDDVTANLLLKAL